MANIRDSLSHTKWLCKYHIVFASKYRRKAIYGQYKESIGENTAAAVQLQRRGNHRRASDERPYPYASEHTTQVQRVAIHGIPERQEQPDDIRQARKPEI